MDVNQISDILFPCALFLVMFNVGLSLELELLGKALKQKKPLLLGLLGQMVVLPLLGFLLVYVFKFPLEVGVGIIIVTVCPGGWVSNSLSTNLRGDARLSIALTTFSTLLCVFTTPFYINLALLLFYPENTLDFSFILTSGKISMWVIIPALLGLFLRYRMAELSESIMKIIRPLSIIIIILILIGSLVRVGDHFAAHFKEIGFILFFLNITIMLLSYYLSKAFKCSPDQSITIAVETGIQNIALAIVMGMSILNKLDVAIPPIIYTIMMFASVSFLLFFYKRKRV
ncbi:MAG: hypothetical protein GY827_09685 [Cytophagales bacterium]|nr:hypothetical protein [Cytophagales bacterium]